MTMTTGERLIIAGAGALGSQIAMHLAHPDREFLIIDDDRVGEENLLTTVYSRQHVGAMKAVVLGELLWRKCRCKTRAITHTLENSRQMEEIVRDGWPNNPRVLVDTFDNPEARSLTCGWMEILTLHAGVSENRTGSVVWDPYYKEPSGPPRGENPICTHELGRPILRFTAVVAARAVEECLAVDWHDAALNLNCYFCTEDMRVVQ